MKSKQSALGKVRVGQEHSGLEVSAPQNMSLSKLTMHSTSGLDLLKESEAVKQRAFVGGLNFGSDSLKLRPETKVLAFYLV